MSLSFAFSRLTSVALFVFVVGCGSGGLTDTDGNRVSLQVEKTSAAEGTVASFVFPGANLTAPTYSGTFGGQPATFYRLDDSTLVTIVPAIGAQTAAIEVNIGDVIAEATFMVTTGQPITNPDAQVVAPLDQFVAADLKQPAPAGYGASWSSDSASVASQVAAGKAAWNSLTPAERIEVARALSFSASAGGATMAAATKSECKAIVAGFKADYEKAREAYAAWEFWGAWAFKRIVAGAVAVVRYTATVIKAGMISQRCTTWRNFDLTSTPRNGPGSDFPDISVITVVAGRWRTTIPRTASGNPVSDALAACRRMLETIGEKFGRVYTADGVEVQEGDTEVVPGDRISLLTTQVASADGPVALGFEVFETAVFQTPTPAVKVMSTLKAPQNAKLTFQVDNEYFGEDVESTFEATVSLPPVCYEGSKKFRGCVAKVEAATSKTVIMVGQTANVTARMWDQFGTEVQRDVLWTATGGNSASSTSSTTGVVTGVTAAKPVTVTATSINNTKGTTSLEVVNPMSVVGVGQPAQVTGTNTNSSVVVNGVSYPAGRKTCEFNWKVVVTGGTTGTLKRWDWTQTSSKGTETGGGAMSGTYQAGEIPANSSWWWTWSDAGTPVFVPFSVTITYTYRDEIAGVDRISTPLTLTCT